MSVINESFVLETIDMIRLYNLDIRTVTLALSLRDCISDDVDKVCDNIHSIGLRCKACGGNNGTPETVHFKCKPRA